MSEPTIHGYGASRSGETWLERQCASLRAERDAMIDAQQLTDERLERVERQLEEARALTVKQGKDLVHMHSLKAENANLRTQLEEARAEVERLRAALGQGEAVSWIPFFLFLAIEGLIFAALLGVVRYSKPEKLKDKMQRLKESGRMDVDL